jgi:hypothetical protein
MTNNEWTIPGDLPPALRHSSPSLSQDAMVSIISTPGCPIRTQGKLAEYRHQPVGEAVDRKESPAQPEDRAAPEATTRAPLPGNHP